jgi:hypothetical protein
MNTLTQKQMDTLKKLCGYETISNSAYVNALEIFGNAAFALGVAQEREACAKVAESFVLESPNKLTASEAHIMDNTAIGAGRAIRARK